MQAISLGHSAIAMALLGIGADPNHASHGGRLGKLQRQKRKKILKANPLHLACLNAMVDVVQMLLEKGCKFNSPDASGLFPIHLAASRNSSSESNSSEDENSRLECIKLLLQAGAPLTMKDSNKQSILHASARAGHCRILRYVLKLWKEQISTQSNKRGSLDWRGKLKSCSALLFLAFALCALIFLCGRSLVQDGGSLGYSQRPCECSSSLIGVWV